jgi:hypothetical protein
MKTKFITEKIHYDGTQLKSLFAYLEHKLLGDSIVSFCGSCDVSFDHMVDGEDFLAGSAIRGSMMLHFIVEEFGQGLELMVTRQRLLTSIVYQELIEKGKIGLKREGDDIYVGEGKLSISIATVSPVSGLIHFAMNISNVGTPVKTASLEDLCLNPQELAQTIMSKYALEVTSIKEACQKVHWVK